MSLQFSAASEKKFEAIVARYPRRDAALLPVLWLAQEEFDHISSDVKRLVSAKLGVSIARIDSVLGFYTLYKTKKIGTYHLQVCKNISCHLRGAKEIMAVIEGDLGLSDGQTTADGKFTYTKVECLAACGTAPCMQVNMDYHETLTPESTRRLIQELGAR